MTTVHDTTKPAKPSGTSAASTAFCAHKLELPKGRHLWIDGNGKITAGNGTLDDPKPNAFSLLHITDCPGSTAVCRESCYVHGLEKHAPDTYRLYAHNSAEIREIIAAGGEMLWNTATDMARWIADNCKGGFRWHVSGDIFSADYANFIEHVCYNAPDVRFWIYTRSFEFLPYLMGQSTTRGGNLAINLSADKDNWQAAHGYANAHNLRICYMNTVGGEHMPVDMLNEGDVIFPDYKLRGGTPEGREWFEALEPRNKAMVCPVDYHGKSEERRCGRCDRCLK